MGTMRRVQSRFLLLGLLLLLLAGCGGEELRRCESHVVNLEDYNRVSKEVLDQTHDEKQQLQEDLALAQDENHGLQEDLAQAQAGNQDLRDTLDQALGENQQLQKDLTSSQKEKQGLQDENEELEETLAGTQDEIEELRDGLVRPELDLDSVRERLWILFHDESPAVWACDEGANQGVRVKEMPSASPETMVEELNDRFQALNPEYESPGLVLERMDGDTAVVSLAQANVVTEQMGSTGAQCYLAGVTFSLTSFAGIDHVRFDIKEGSHGGPGRYDRADFVYFLPLELPQP